MNGCLGCDRVLCKRSGLANGSSLIARLPRNNRRDWRLSSFRERRRVRERDRDGRVHDLQVSHNRWALVTHGSMPVER